MKCNFVGAKHLGCYKNYLPGQHLMCRKIKIKGSPLLRDLDQVEVTTEKVEGTIVKTTESNNQGRSEVERLFRQPHRTTLAKTIVGKKEVQNQNTQKPERMIDSPVLQPDLLQYDYLTISNHPTTLSMMARPYQGNGSGFTRNRSNWLEEMTISRPCSFPWPQKPCPSSGSTN